MTLTAKLCLFVVLSLFAVAGAKADKGEAFRGIFCTSQEAMERVVVLGKERGGAQEGIIAVNVETPQACFYGTIIGVRTKIVGTIDSPDGLLDITAWRILKVVMVADFEHGRMVPVGIEVVDEVIRYTLEGSKQTPA